MPYVGVGCPFRAGDFIGPFSQGVALGFHILPLQGKCRHTEGAQAPELAEGALTKPYIYTVAHASGSESSVLFPLLMLQLLLILPSV